MWYIYRVPSTRVCKLRWAGYVLYTKKKKKGSEKYLLKCPIKRLETAVDK